MIDRTLPYSTVYRLIMSENNNPNQPKDYSGFGLAITIIYVVVVLIIMVLTRDKFLELAPNNWGDFLAGAFGPLALGWLVISTFQQREELRQNTRALNLQVDELKESVKQQSALAEANQKMIEHEIEKTHVSSQPIIVRERIKTIRGNGKLWLEVTLANKGNYVTNTLFSITSHEHEVELIGHFLSFWGKDQQWEIAIPLDAIESALTLKIQYMDGMMKKWDVFWIIGKTTSPKGDDYFALPLPKTPESNKNII